MLQNFSALNCKKIRGPAKPGPLFLDFICVNWYHLIKKKYFPPCRGAGTAFCRKMQASEETILDIKEIYYENYYYQP